jgi:hypothetical protein
LAEPAPARSPAPRRHGLVSLAAHAALVLWVFAGLLAGRVPYLRDLSSQYLPDYAFTAEALRQGVWPLWNPAILAGTPWLVAYPPELVSLWLLGPLATLCLMPPLHVLLAMRGTTALASRLGASPLAAWIAGAAFGLSGALLSLVNLMRPQLIGAAWLPWLLAALLAAGEAATRRRVLALAWTAAAIVSALAAETLVHAALLALAVLPWSGVRRWRGFLLASGLAALIAAPALAGGAALLAGSARGEGFDRADKLAFSATPAVLLEALVPSLFGDPHTATGRGDWSGSQSPTGFPYLLSVYLGPTLLGLLLAARRPRLLAVALGLVALAAGSHGPFGGVVASLPLVRAPVKFLVPASLAVSLLAALALDRARASRGATWWLCASGGGVLLAGFGAWLSPAGFVRLVGGELSDAMRAAAESVAGDVLPETCLRSGALALAAAAALARRAAWLVPIALVADLLAVNGTLNRLAPPDFFALRPEVAALLEPVRAAQPARVFSYGFAYSEAARLRTLTPELDDDVLLYHLDRQALLPRGHVLDRLEGAFEIDRDGLAPAGASLSLAETRPSRFREIATRLREANVRFVLGFAQRPAELATPRGSTALPGVVPPLRLHELEGALPRAFFTADERPPFRVAPAVAVRFERLGPPAIALEGETPPGLLVVLEGHAPGWRVYEGEAERPLFRVGLRYRAVATPGGRRRFEMRYEPAWRLPALALAGLGLALSLALLGRADRASP